MDEMKKNSCLPEEHEKNHKEEQENERAEIFCIFEKAEVKDFVGMMKKVKELVGKGWLLNPHYDFN